MVEGELRTVADELVELVKKRKKLSVEEIANILKMVPAEVQMLVDFFVEEGVFGVEYKFTTPYIYLNEKKVEEKPKKEIRHKKGQSMKDEFFEKAKERNLSHQKTQELWRKYLTLNMHSIREKFYEKARKRQIPNSEISDLWERYRLVLEESK